ncbi:MAG: YegS/Rv2252/BmrU family lipid kinase [Oscillospiraceae bacterium]|nr:YegS/Rv2252/BmrU family lipid kinase [Oscillospiraceae bacterium]
MKKLLFIMNPYAGMRKAARQLADIIEIFNRAGYAVDIHMTAGPGDGQEVVRRRAHQVERVVCCGGDGTFNETVSGVLLSGVDVPIGYIPAGSTNDFAASLHLPTDILKAARCAVEGVPQRYDVGRFGNRYFSYVASFGIFTRASYATPQNVKNALGHTAYILSGLQELGQLKSHRVRLELEDGRVVEDEYLFGAISNSTSVGGILTLDPKQVDMQDGKFEILLLRAPKDLGEVAECLVALQKQEYNCRMITFLNTSRVTVYANPAMDWTLDGERASGAEEIFVKNLQHAIQIVKGES